MQRQFTVIVFVLLSFICKAQHFTNKFEIPLVEKNGYYHLLLSPDVLAVSQNDLSDIRIKDKKTDKEMPYILRSENPREQTSSFQDYKILENGFDKKDSVTRVVVDNDTNEEVKQFCIVIQNAEISKFISIRGSNDKNIWYVVKQKSQADPGIKNDTNTETLVVDVPSGKYRYYEILITNPQKDPILVLTVGKYLYSEILGKYTEVTLGNFIQKDSTDKKSYLFFPEIKRNYLINRIHFNISDKQFYLRKGQFLIQEYNKDKSIFYIPGQSFTLSSQEDNTIDIFNMHINRSTVLTIENKDNNPLHITGISAYQINRYLTVYLEEGAHYALFCGDKSLSGPEYDLVYFEKNIPRGLPVLTLNAIENIPQVVTPQVIEEPSFWETQTFLWLVLVVVGIFLLWICYTMVKDMKKRK